MEWQFIECAVTGYLSAYKELGAVPTLKQLEQVALTATGRDDMEDLNVAALGDVGSYLAKELSKCKKETEGKA
jgi:hypothetical protein